MRDNIAWYNQINATVLAISVDSPQTLAKYKEEQRLNFILLSDFNKEVSKAYHTLYEVFGFNMKGVSKRSAFVIDAEGPCNMRKYWRMLPGFPTSPPSRRCWDN